VTDSVTLTDGGFTAQSFTLPADISDGIYTVRVTTSEQEVVTVSFRVDSTAPPCPQFRHRPLSEPNSKLDGSFDSDLDGFRVYRKINTADGWQLVSDTLSKTALSFIRLWAAA
jgi:hypothetical protein